MPSLTYTLLRCQPTVRADRKSCVPISGLVRPSQASRAMRASCAVSSVPDRRGETGRVEDVGEQRAVGLPPLPVGHAGARLAFRGFDGSPGGAANVVVEQAGSTPSGVTAHALLMAAAWPVLLIAVFFPYPCTATSASAAEIDPRCSGGRRSGRLPRPACRTFPEIEGTQRGLNHVLVVGPVMTRRAAPLLPPELVKRGGVTKKWDFALNVMR